MPKPEMSLYTPLDFVGWREAKSLDLAPKFQRRGVWTPAARSYLIDTLIRGMPVPPLYLRTRQSEDRKRIIREVVDGQQRISAVLDYLEGKFATSKTLDAPHAGKRFDQLNTLEQDAIRQFTFICQIFQGVSDKEILEVFARLNTYSVPLNEQELRNGTYFGYFKQSAYRLAYEHIEFWRNHRIFSERQIARMAEVEFTSELMIAQIDGLQDKKKSIDRFYSDLDEKFDARSTIESRFRGTIDIISEAVGDILSETEFRRSPLFYSLFCAVYHRLYGLPRQTLPTARRKLTAGERVGVAKAVTELSARVVAAREGDEGQTLNKFIVACLRQTDNLQPRQIRFETIYQRAFA